MATPEPVIRSDARPRWHYAFVVAAVTFGVILVTAGVRAAPGAFIVPLEGEYGWSRGSISLAVALSILAYGFGAPLAGGLIDRYGPRRLAVTGCFLIAAGLLPMLWMTQEWQLFVFWGLIVGVGTGAVGGVLGATVATRWFRSQRGLVIGLFSAASSMGQLIFLPSLVTLIVASGWRAAVAGMAVAVLLAAIPAFLFLRDRPADVGLQPYGDDGSAAAAAAELTEAAEGSTLRQATRTRDFWLLAGSFFVCGYTSNGIIGTHLIPHAVEHGFSVDIGGRRGRADGDDECRRHAEQSGWLTDRYDNRKLLAFYYAFRALSIVVPAGDPGRPAAVPVRDRLRPRLDRDGPADGQPHGAALWAGAHGHDLWLDLLLAHDRGRAGGVSRRRLPRPPRRLHLMFLSAGLLGFIAAGMALRVSVTGRPGSTPAPSVSAA